MSGWLIRKAGPDDVEAIVALEARAFGPARWGAAAIRDGVGAPYVEALVGAAADGPVQGFALWRRLGDEGEILSLAVDGPARGRGLAKALLAEIILSAEAQRVGALFLEVDAGNAPALGLYARAHFQQVGRRRGYYRNGADALVLRRATGAPI